jgi:hypothetical protein
MPEGRFGPVAGRLGTVADVPRHNKSRRTRSAKDTPERPVGGLGWAHSESGSDGDWLVRPITGAKATKTYRCPGCDHEIPPGTGHVVAWPDDALGSVQDRRHWHTSCWSHRTRRGPTSKRW